MARVAVFVDAGYLLARGAEAITGLKEAGRRGVILDVGKVIEALIEFAENKADCPGEILRIYWYDAAGAQPTAEHIRLAGSDNVKLRLGTINSFGEQKGVDSLIIADMIELARNHASGSFVLVGGDEDLRVAVQVAQTYGIRVHLMGVSIGDSKAQSPALAREADTNSGWIATDVANFLTVRPVPQAALLPVAAPATFAPAAPAANVPAHNNPIAPISQQMLQDAVQEFYETLTETDVDEIRTVWIASHSIPQPHDGRLLARTGATVGRALDASEKREMRRIFTRLLEEHTGPSDSE